MSNFTEISELKQTAELNANLVCTCRAETSKVMFFLNLYNPGPFIKWTLCLLRNYWFKTKRIYFGGVLQR